MTASKATSAQLRPGAMPHVHTPTERTNMNRTNRLACAFACLSFALTPLHAVAASPQSFEEMKRRTTNLTALIDAENNKSPLCQSYLGKIIAPVAFDALYARFGKVAPKGEFETTATYQARAARAGSPSSEPFVLLVPISRDYVTYDSDQKAMAVNAGAFAVASLGGGSDEDVMAGIALGDWFDGRTNITVQKSERVLGSDLRRTGLGIPIRVSRVERHYKWLSMPGDSLFAFATDKHAPVMLFEVAPAQARQAKATLRLAIVAVPEAPYTFTDVTDGPVPSAQNAEESTYRTSLVTASARCALVVNAQLRVLASADAGAAKGKRDGE